MPDMNSDDTLPIVTLPLLRIEISHGEGIDVFDPNEVLVAALETQDAASRWPPLPGGACRSVLSGAPAAIYRTMDKQIPLAPDELRRMILHALEPWEALKMRAIFGDLFEIHADFYDPDTGEALQPAI